MSDGTAERRQSQAPDPETLGAELERAKNALAAVVRLQIAQGLAAAFLDRKQPYLDDPTIQGLLGGGLLARAAFIQKSPRLLRFYQRLLTGFDRPVRRVLEIGVKGGGSTAFWKALFPTATVIGMDVRLRYGLDQQPSVDGVLYLEGDQSDPVRLKEIGSAHGPFDLVIDDGSHISDHQLITMRQLIRQVAPGGAYVVEDIHTGVKGEQDVYGEDIWPDFVAGILQQLRMDKAPAQGRGFELARSVGGAVDDLILGRRVLAIRVNHKFSAVAPPSTTVSHPQR